MNATVEQKAHIEDELNQPNTFDAVRNMTYVPEDRALIRTEDVYQTQTEHGVEGYGPEVLRICATFDNSGVLAEANAVGMCGRSKHGEEMALISMVVDPDTLVVRDAAFRASGTLAMIASASLAATMARGRTLDEVLEITGPTLREHLGAIPDAAFRASGTLAMIASASLAATMARGRTLDEVLEITGPTLREHLGAIPADRATRPHIAAEALRAAVGDYYVRQGLGLQEVLAAVPCDTASIACLQCEHCSYRTSQLDMRMRAFGLTPRTELEELVEGNVELPI